VKEINLGNENNIASQKNFRSWISKHPHKHAVT